MPAVLSVNLNKIALVRNQRRDSHPDILRAAEQAVEAGARGITVHPRPDERHIRANDVQRLASFLSARYGDRIEINIEGYPATDFLSLVHSVRPHQTTLVPDSPDVLTSDQGWDIAAHQSFLRQVISDLKGIGTRVALFLEPDPDSVSAAAAVGADRIELYTEHFARAWGSERERAGLARYAAAARAAAYCGLGVNAGHDLNLDNLPAFAAAVPNLLEVSIGHFLVSDALEMGLESSVRAYLAALSPQAA